jgi:nucleoside-diphosphate-sugar epimerase
MRIVILGGLGYIGSALCDIYRDKPQHQVVVVDKNFIAPYIEQFPDHWGFVYANIGDTLLMKRILADADIAYLLASEVEAEKSKDKAAVMWDINFRASSALAGVCPDTCRLVFTSTGNVFGGADRVGPWKEEDEPEPKFPYAETKMAMENFLTNRGGNYSIVRFGTNYGFAPCTRFNLVTNLFARKAMMGEDIFIHGDGSNVRPTVCVRDAAAALYWVAHQPVGYQNLFHVASESISIKELAERVVMATGRKSEIKYDRGKQPAFSGYALDSTLIQHKGFEFNWNIEAAMKVMKYEFRDFWSD